jgi:protein disulfide-isomerase A1
MAVFLALLGLAAASNVIEIGDFNITGTTQTNDFVLVYFYSPTCSHCKTLNPHYEQAAQLLKQQGVPVVLAKLNSKENRRSIDAFKIKAYPTLKFFEQGVAVEYAGGRTYQDIYSWVLRRLNPTVTLGSAEELKTHLETVNPNTFVMFGGGQKRREVFIEAAKAFNGISFALLDDEAARRHYEAEPGDFVLFKPVNEPILFYTGDLELLAITRFLLTKTVPKIAEISQESLNLLTDHKIPQFLYFVSRSDFNLALEALEEAEDLVSETYLIRYADLGDLKQMEDYFDISAEDMPLGVFVHNNGVYLEKYKYLGNIDGSSIRAFYRSIKAGTATPYYKDEGKLKEGSIKVTRNLFREVVLDPTMHVLVIYTASYDTQWQSFRFDFSSLEEKYSETDDIRLKVFDLNLNDPYDLEVQKIPTIKLYTKQNKTGILYTGELVSESVEAFIKEHCSESIKTEL